MINLKIGDKLELKYGRELVAVPDTYFPCNHGCVLAHTFFILKDGRLLRCADLHCLSISQQPDIHLEFVEGGSNEN